ncbi:MAG: hypothetical protein FWD69_13220 [Polyangiaceae bacterium]|nr:hypothetical protein [Polyangiaceae bacterium]
MQSIRCQHCGAPPASVDPSQSSFVCTYCNQTTTLQAPPSQAPSIYVVQAPSPPDPIQYSVAHQVGAAVASRIIWVVVVLVVSIGAGAARHCARASYSLASGNSLGDVWDGSKPFKCGGNDDVSFRDVKSVLPGDTAIQASGNCHVHCTNCSIAAAGAIEASGNAEVTFVNGYVNGTIFLVNANGNARVTILGNVTAFGRVEKSGNARVSAPERPSPSVATPPATTPPLVSPVSTPPPVSPVSTAPRATQPKPTAAPKPTPPTSPSRHAPSRHERTQSAY